MRVWLVRCEGVVQRVDRSSRRQDRADHRRPGARARPARPQGPDTQAANDDAARPRAARRRDPQAGSAFEICYLRLPRSRGSSSWAACTTRSSRTSCTRSKTACSRWRRVATASMPRTARTTSLLHRSSISSYSKDEINIDVQDEYVADIDRGQSIESIGGVDVCRAAVNIVVLVTARYLLGPSSGLRPNRA